MRPLPGACAAFVPLALFLACCAKKAPPSGGPPDIEPPRLVASTPDSGQAGVARDATLSLTFSEGMEPRTTGDAIALAPHSEIRHRRWRGRTVTVVLAESLRANQTYVLFVGGGARDRHGNTFGGSASLVFSTADTLPPGRLEGRIDARGFPPAGSYLWCYDAATDRAPDSTARDFDALGFADADGNFRVVGLAVPSRYRLWTFADLNGNRSYDPRTDVLAPADTVLALTREQPVARDLMLTVVNPRAPGRVRGAVLDSLGIVAGALSVVAVAQDDSTNQVKVDTNDRSEFEVQLEAGTWKLRAFRDLDRNQKWDAMREPASDPMVLAITPAVDVEGLVFVLGRPAPK